MPAPEPADPYAPTQPLDDAPPHAAQPAAGSAIEREAADTLLEVPGAAHGSAQPVPVPPRSAPIFPMEVVFESGLFQKDEVVGERFCLVEKIGESTFGVVWKARDLRLDREVAIKFLKAEVRMPKILARFELEQQVLARMDHPNIAKVFDGGTTADGRPFLAMELLRGQPLGVACDERKLPVAARLELFAAICRAVHHAHQNGVIHRDLKPGNIMVVEEDGRPTPKVIDFGIAKVLDSGDFTAAGTETLAVERVGTPLYMSPEQAAGEEQITALTDVYSLGVILYELLAGQTPFVAETSLKSRRASIERLLSAIRTEDASPPSAQLGSTRADQARISALRASSGPRLIAAVRGDLDAIVMKAIEKDPDRRYESAAALAEDVARHLRLEPVTAREGGTGYRLGRWIRRHKAAAVAAGVIGVAIIATAGISTRAYFIERAALGRETIERQKAVVARNMEAEARTLADVQKEKAVAARNAADQARQVAVRARGEAEDLVNYMLFDLREQLEPLGRTRLLESISLRAEKYFEDQPAATDDDTLERNRAVMFYNRGRILLAQARVADAATAFTQARELMEKRTAAKPGDAPRQLDLARALDGLGLATLAAGKTDASREIFERQLALLPEEPGDIPASLLRASTLERLGDIAQRAGQLDPALAHYTAQETLLRRLRTARPDDRAVQQALAIACEKLGTLHERQGRFADALARYEEEREIFRPLAEKTPGDLVLRRSVVVSLGKIGGALLALQRRADALAPLTEALRAAEDLARIDPVNLDLQRDLAAAHQRLGTLHRDEKRHTESLDHFARDIALLEALTTREPANPAFQQDLAIAHAQRAMTLLARAASADLPAARESFTRSRDLLARLSSARQLDASGEKWLTSVEKTLVEMDKLPPARPR